MSKDRRKDRRIRKGHRKDYTFDPLVVWMWGAVIIVAIGVLVVIFH